MSGQNAHLLESNQEKYRALNIDKWHKKGFTGKGVRILIIAEGAIRSEEKGYVTNINNPTRGRGSYHEGDFIIHQIAPKAEIFSINIHEGTGHWSMMQALQWALDNNIHVIVCPMGIGYWSDQEKWEGGLSRKLREKGVLMFGAAGNDAKEFISYPARNEHWFAISEYNPNRYYGNIQNYGNELSCITLSSFANQIRPPSQNDPRDKGDYIPVTDTSGTMPPMGGMAALLKEAYPDMNHDMFLDYLKQHCDRLGKSGWSKENGWGFFKLPAQAPELPSKNDPIESPIPPPSNNDNSNTRYSDISNHWAKEDIEFLNKLGIVNGYPDGTFKPNNQVTRAEVSRIIANALRYLNK